MDLNFGGVEKKAVCICGQCERSRRREESVIVIFFFSFRRDTRAVLMGEEGRREHEREGVLWDTHPPPQKKNKSVKRKARGGRGGWRGVRAEGRWWLNEQEKIGTRIHSSPRRRGPVFSPNIPAPIPTHPLYTLAVPYTLDRILIRSRNHNHFWPGPIFNLGREQQKKTPRSGILLSIQKKDWGRQRYCREACPVGEEGGREREKKKGVLWEEKREKGKGK